MSILLPGYYGATNSGDTATLAAIVRLVEEVSPNQYYHILSYHLGEKKDMDEYMPKGRYDFCWFDQLPKDTKLLLIGNAGVPGGTSLNTVASCLDKKIPVIATCLKTGMRADSHFNKLYQQILPHFSLAMCRLKANAESWQSCGFSNVLYGADLAVYNDMQETDLGGLAAKDYVVCCPRFCSDALNAFQIKWFVEMITSHPHIPFIFVSLAESDEQLSHFFRFFPNVRISNLKHYQFAQVMHLMHNAKLVISGGRFHALVYATDVSTPSVLITPHKPQAANVTEEGGDFSRFIGFCRDFKLPFGNLPRSLDALLQNCQSINFSTFSELKMSTKQLIKQTLEGILT